MYRPRRIVWNGLSTDTQSEDCGTNCWSERKGEEGRKEEEGRLYREGMYAGRQKGEYAVRQTVISQIGLAALCLCAS